MIKIIVCSCIPAFIAFIVFITFIAFFAPSITQQVGHQLFDMLSTFHFNDNEDNMNILKASTLPLFVLLVSMLVLKLIPPKDKILVVTGFCHRCEKETGLLSKVWCDKCFREKCTSCENNSTPGSIFCEIHRKKLFNVHKNIY